MGFPRMGANPRPQILHLHSGFSARKAPEGWTKTTRNLHRGKPKSNGRSDRSRYPADARTASHLGMLHRYPVYGNCT